MIRSSLSQIIGREVVSPFKALAEYEMIDIGVPPPIVSTDWTYRLTEKSGYHQIEILPKLRLYLIKCPPSGVQGVVLGEYPYKQAWDKTYDVVLRGNMVQQSHRLPDGSLDPNLGLTMNGADTILLRFPASKKDAWINAHEVWELSRTTIHEKLIYDRAFTWHVQGTGNVAFVEPFKVGTLLVMKGISVDDYRLLWSEVDLKINTVIDLQGQVPTVVVASKDLPESRYYSSDYGMWKMDSRGGDELKLVLKRILTAS